MEFLDLQITEIAGVVRYRPGARRWQAKQRAHHIVGIQLYGKAEHRFADRTLTLAEHGFYFLNQKDDYTVEMLEEPAEAFSIHFSTARPVTTPSFFLPLSHTGEFLPLLERAQTAAEQGNRLELFSLVYRFLAGVERIQKKSYRPEDGRLTRAREILDLHFRERDCLRQAVAASGLGERRLRELFSHRFDCTPHRYLLTKRLEYAKSLLSLGSLSVSQVAELCLFSDVFYFSKVFKRETGLSPGAWAADRRTSHRKKP